jgi:hypothetical protein
MPSQKEIDAGKKLTERGPSDEGSKWLVQWKDNPTVWRAIFGDSADHALRLVGKSFADVHDICYVDERE